MPLQQRDLDMADRSREKGFSLYRREGDAMVEGVEQSKDLGRPLDKMDDDWPAVRRNIKRERKV